MNSTKAAANPSNQEGADEFSRRGVSFVKKLSLIDEGLWGFELTDADGYVLAFFQVRS